MSWTKSWKADKEVKMQKQVLRSWNQMSDSQKVALVASSVAVLFLLSADIVTLLLSGAAVGVGYLYYREIKKTVDRSK